VQTEVRRLAVGVAAWLERRELTARTVTIKVRYSDFTTITRSHSALPTHDAGDIAGRAVELLQKTEAGARPIRLLGVSVHNFTTGTQPPALTRADRLPFEDD
jgi:DNA polymerase IV